MIFNIYKPVSWTSFDIVKKIRTITGVKKVGHGGTLDPFAEGVLIIGTGSDTKKLTDLCQADKSYAGVLKLGEETDTLDPEGTVVKFKSVTPLSKSMIKKIFSRFLGSQEQIPPMFSAKRIDGVRLYKLARNHIELERQPVNITIHQLELQNYSKNTIVFTVTCSKGTYIRVLASEIANALGTVGHLTKLIRTRVGNYSIDDAITISTFEKTWLSTAQ